MTDAEQLKYEGKKDATVEGKLNIDLICFLET